ncbi:MAG: carbohydrate ABC transporter permease [Oscillospiraceae bacterium]|nr:carbohydrate ABC transporter permease [Oscillospiraceae bacterium]
MNAWRALRDKWASLARDTRLQNERRHAERQARRFLFALFRAVIIFGISYVILGPLIGILANSFFSNEDKYSPIVYLIPQNPTLERYRLALLRMDYFRVLGRMLLYVTSLTVLQLAVCAMVGYGFARFNFPLKKILFACVIVMIVLPSHTIMYPLYNLFQNNPGGLFGWFNNGNLLGSPLPMFLMTALGTGLRSGLFIFIFNQFFRGLPKEIEEAALIDGAGSIRTFIQVMIPNATPAIVTVAIFSAVWQYNDSFYGRLFNISDNILLSRKLSTLQRTIANLDMIRDPSISTLYVYAGVVFMILPLLLMYIFLQKYFIEGVERSGIVG